MDSVLDDIDCLMALKQETPNSNVRANPAAQGVQNNDTEQLAMSTYMIDFILDYINRSLKVLINHLNCYNVAADENVKQMKTDRNSGDKTTQITLIGLNLKIEHK